MNVFQQLFRMIFWYWLPAPKIGDRYRWADSEADPWCTDYLQVTERRGNWYRLRNQNGYYQSKHRSDLVSLYVKIGFENPDDSLPF